MDLAHIIGKSCLVWIIFIWCCLKDANRFDYGYNEETFLNFVYNNTIEKIDHWHFFLVFWHYLMWRHLNFFIFCKLRTETNILSSHLFNYQTGKSSRLRSSQSLECTTLFLESTIKVYKGKSLYFLWSVQYSTDRKCVHWCGNGRTLCCN